MPDQEPDIIDVLHDYAQKRTLDAARRGAEAAGKYFADHLNHQAEQHRSLMVEGDNEKRYSESDVRAIRARDALSYASMALVAVDWVTTL